MRLISCKECREALPPSPPAKGRTPLQSLLALAARQEEKAKPFPSGGDSVFVSVALSRASRCAVPVAPLTAPFVAGW